VSFKIPPDTNVVGMINNFEEFIFVKKVGNIISIKTGCFVYVIFKRGSLCETVNATGLKGFNQIEECLYEFSCLFSFDRVLITHFKVDNMTASARTNILPAFDAFLHYPRGANIQRIHYNPELFPGASIKFKGGWGTVMFFRSGALSFVGARRMGHLLLMRDELLKRLRSLSPLPGGGRTHGDRNMHKLCISNVPSVIRAAAASCWSGRLRCSSSSGSSSFRP
jgi:TATA-box binding protein (TBP) (component of TFIID and TFIIIB)